MQEEKIYRVELRFDIRANSDQEAVEVASRSHVTVDGDSDVADNVEITAIFNEDFDEI